MHCIYVKALYICSVQMTSANVYKKKFFEILNTKKCKNKAFGLWVTYLRTAER